jgi:hypothetical protein
MSTAEQPMPQGNVTQGRFGERTVGETGAATRAQAAGLEKASTLVAAGIPLKVPPLKVWTRSEDEFTEAAKRVGAAQVTGKTTERGRPHLKAVKDLGGGVRVEVLLDLAYVRDVDEAEELVTFEAQVQAALDAARGVNA